MPCSNRVSLCWRRDGLLDQEVDGVKLGAIDTGVDLDELAAAIEDDLDTLSHGQARAQKLVGYRQRLARIATRLGRALFGQRGNPLHQLLCTLHTQASAQAGFVGISLASERPQVHNLPWELAAWSPVHDHNPASHLGTDPHLALSRRAHYDRGLVPERTVARASHVRILHITANRHERQYEHERIAGYLDQLGQCHPRVHARAAYSEDWTSAPPRAAAEHVDIFQLLTHGARVPGCLELAVEERSSDEPSRWSPGLEIDIPGLVHLLGPERLPRLIILLSCWSFDHYDRRGAVADLLGQHGISAAIGILGPLRLGKAAALSRYLFSQLADHGQLDLAVQRVRALLMRYELGRSMRPDTRLPSDWFRPVLMTRTPHTCESFAHLATSGTAMRAAQVCPRAALQTFASSRPTPADVASFEARRLDAVVDALASGLSHAHVGQLLDLQPQPRTTTRTTTGQPGHRK